MFILCLLFFFFFLMIRRPPRSTLLPYTMLLRSFVADIDRLVVDDDGCHALSHSGLRLARSEEHTSELQSHSDLVCRLLLEKKKKTLDVADFFMIQTNMFYLVLVSYRTLLLNSLG